jgi:DNA-binding response OmpR family regulator
VIGGDARTGHHRAVRVLWIDDERDMGLYTRVVFESEDDAIEHRYAPDGLRGLELSREWRPDVAWIDCMMPVMDSFTTLERWRVDPALAPIPRIMCTAKTSPVDKIRGLERGAAAYVTRPFPMEVLVPLSREVLGGPRAPFGPPSVYRPEDLAELRSGELE